MAKLTRETLKQFRSDFDVTAKPCDVYRKEGRDEPRLIWAHG